MYGHALRTVLLLDSYYIFKDFIHLFLERGERRKKERERNSEVREKHQSVASRSHPNLGPNLHQGMCLDRE